MRHALRVALDAGIPSPALRAYYNLSCTLYYGDNYDAALEHAREGVAYARRFGDRNWEGGLLALAIGTLVLQGKWNAALAFAREVPRLDEVDAPEEVTPLRFAAVELLGALPQMYVARGELDEAERFVLRFADFRDSADVQERSAYASGMCMVQRGRGRFDEALATGLAAFAAHESLGSKFLAAKLGFVGAAEAATELGDLDRLESLLAVVADLGAGKKAPFLDAHAERFRARLAAARGEAEEGENAFKAAAGLMREIGLPFWLAVTELEHAEWLDGQGRGEEAEALLGVSREIFADLEAAPWLERATRDRTVVS